MDKTVLKKSEKLTESFKKLFGDDVIGNVYITHSFLFPDKKVMEEILYNNEEFTINFVSDSIISLMDSIVIELKNKKKVKLEMDVFKEIFIFKELKDYIIEGDEEYNHILHKDE